MSSKLGILFRNSKEIVCKPGNVEKCDETGETGEDAHKVTNVAKNLQVHKYLVVNSGHLTVVHLTSLVIILVRGKYFKVIWKAFFRLGRFMK
ncbi:hypothetical protein COLO4_31631 [Corchorus olitorius]|uniref:Uncharacterized protein n=1 Tax=Corchorus olitorius TaxID=93759 RepID=A0A1R3H3W2_9ROSI|nr:hypothetical protein COLO4_31631 [Corchorus olitorius]